MDQSELTKILFSNRQVIRKYRPLPFIVESKKAVFLSDLSKSSQSGSSVDLELEVRTAIETSYLFDEVFYTAAYPDIANANISALEHYLCQGHLEGRRPNVVFDPTWYRRVYMDNYPSDYNCLYHYITVGRPNAYRPTALFDPAWYKERYGLSLSSCALKHYLLNYLGPYSPIAEFDAEYYHNTYPDIANAQVNAFEHYISYGYREGRNPSPDFDTSYYIKAHLKGSLELNPLLHYLEHRTEGINCKPSENDATIPANIKLFTRPAKEFEELRAIAASNPKRAKILAYYLPQFHAFEENDRWWGKGFTEWTNLARGIPRFHGHYQPRIPRDIGFYSLESSDVMRKQIELAKAGGLYGFVFYYYWFNTKRLMERPIEAFLADQSLDMPFCLMWANESWTRRWDGLEGEVLISQDYSEKDDEKLIADFARHFADSRYIRLGRRPLLMVYRPTLIPNIETTIGKWRELFKDKYAEDPIIIMSQSFDHYDPTDFGLDGAIEFPPHKLTKLTPLINDSVQYLDHSFSGQVYSYDDVVNVSLNEVIPDYPLIKTAVPSWDNDARRQGTGLVIHGSTPAAYESWLSKLIQRAQRETFFGEAIVCINAWNEWCEGAYLEPDLHFGAAYLNATGRAVTGLTQSSPRPRLVLIGHDAFPSGAQLLLLNIGRMLQRAFGIEIEYILLRGGKLEPDYSDVAPTVICPDAAKLNSRLQDLKARGFLAVISNTSVSGHAAACASELGLRTIFLIHELPRIMREKGLEPAARAGLHIADKVVFAARYILDNVLKSLEVEPSDRFVIRPQGSYKSISPQPELSKSIRQELGIGSDHYLVLGAGYADIRKGFDLFLQTWQILRAHYKNVHFCWVGGIDPSMKDWLSVEIEDAETTGTFHMPGYRNDVEAFFAAADAFALTSREDPFPTVALEAMSAGVPVFAFERTGGIPEFLAEHNVGYVVPYGSSTSLAERLGQVFRAGPDLAMIRHGLELVRTRFAFKPYVWDLVGMALPMLTTVSVVLPNYNYAKCMPERLATIFTQTYPTQSVIVLDDASPDDSVAVIEATAEEHGRDITLIVNEKNSGSVFAQWRKGAELAEGEFLWIAEADDLSEPTFLTDLIGIMRTDPDIKLGFCDSKSIDFDGAPVYESYKPYFHSVEPGCLTQDEVFDGKEFVRRFLSVKNLILNVSSVVWRRAALLEALDACAADLKELRMAGDWRIYLECLAAPGAKIAYVAEPLNTHRRHAASVTHSLNAQKHIDEIARMHEAARHCLQISDPTLQQAKYMEEVTIQLLNP